MLETYPIESIITATTTAEVTLVAAAAGNELKVTYIDDLIASNESATATRLTLKDGAGGTVKFAQWIGANTCIPFRLSRPIRFSPATTVIAQLSAAANVNIHARGRRYST